MLTVAQEPPLLRIHPGQSTVASRLREVWTHKALLYFLTRRDIQVRYNQTPLGAAWAILQPVLTMFLGALAKVPSDGIPYPIYVFCGLVPWPSIPIGATTAYPGWRAYKIVTRPSNTSIALAVRGELRLRSRAKRLLGLLAPREPPNDAGT